MVQSGVSTRKQIIQMRVPALEFHFVCVVRRVLVVCRARRLNAAYPTGAEPAWRDADKSPTGSKNWGVPGAYAFFN